MPNVRFQYLNFLQNDVFLNFNYKCSHIKNETLTVMFRTNAYTMTEIHEVVVSSSDFNKSHIVINMHTRN